MQEEKLVAKRQIALFVTLAIAFAWIVFMLIPVCGQRYGSVASSLLLTGAMFAPALSNLLTRLITKEGFKQMYLHPHLKGHVKEYLLVYFVPTGLLLLSALVYFLIFPSQFDPGFTVLKATLASSGSHVISASKLLMIQFLQVILIGPIINIIPTLGEELGWRGYLLPKLCRFFSVRVALTITGVIWGIWHIPIIVMGHNYGTSYVGYPWLGILAMVVFCVVVGIIEGYVSIKLKSVIPAAMIHSLINAGAAFPIYMAKSGYNPILGPAMTGLIGGLPFVILAIALFVKIGHARLFDKTELG